MSISLQDNQRVEDLISSDLTFLLPLLRQYPKCYWIWNYRSWLLNEATRLLPYSASHRLWSQELVLDSKMLTLDSRNFHGWGYRRMITKSLESENSDSQDRRESVAEAEFEYTTKMIRANLSNFSAWHYRSKLIPRLLDERQADDKARPKILDQGAYWSCVNRTYLHWSWYQNLKWSNEACTPTQMTNPCGFTTRIWCAPSTLSMLREAWLLPCPMSRGLNMFRKNSRTLEKCWTVLKTANGSINSYYSCVQYTRNWVKIGHPRERRCQHGSQNFIS